MSEEKDQRAGEPEEQDVEGHMRARTDDEMREMRGMRAENDEESDDVEGHMRAAMDDEQMRGMRALLGNILQADECWILNSRLSAAQKIMFLPKKPWIRRGY